MLADSRFPILVIGIVALTVTHSLTDLAAVHAQAPPLLADEGDSKPRTPADADPASELELTPEQVLKAEEWLEQLGSPEFATRERASAELMELGKGVLPLLRQAAKESTDAEARLRVQQILKQMTEGDLQARISQFLAGQSVVFAGWYAAQDSLGDSVPIRELFVEMMLSHPEFVESLDGTPRDKSMALEKLVTSVQNKLRSVGQEPGPADVFALLLIANDSKVELNSLFENALLGLMRRQVASSIRRDAQLSGPFYALLNKWIVRSSTTSREDVLLLGMSWDLPATLPLALRTLDEVNTPETIATCFQAISKFGDRSQTETLKRYLDDERPVADRGFSDDRSLPQIRDLAMLTLAMIHGVPLDEIGMPHIQTHPASGFILTDLAYPSNPERGRQKARERIDQLLKQPSEG